MAEKRSEAVVINVLDHGEADRIVTFYCPVLGKLSGIAKGAKRSKKRFVNKLEVFSWLEVIYDDSGRGSLVRIIEAELLDPFISLREHYDRYVVAALIVELMLSWTRENDADEELFPLLLWALNSLNTGQQPHSTGILFQIRLLGIMGYRPDLGACAKCGRLDAAGGPYVFSPGRKGLVCAACRPGGGAQNFPVSISTARLLKNAQDLPLAKLKRLRFSRNSNIEAMLLLKHYGQYLLQREINSWDFVEESLKDK